MFRNPFEGKNLPEATVAEAVAAKESGSHQIVDVREQEEWDAYRIPGSVFIPLGQLVQRAGELDPGKPIIAYCKSGVRSLYAVEMLQASGRHDVASLSGGIVAWYEAGQPLER